jgi:tetratricopeptide (TPR) repeat protein
MKHLVRITFAVFLIAASPFAHAQSSWSTHTRAGEYAFAQGDLERTESEFQAALEIAQGFPAGDLRLETSLENLGRFYEHKSDLDKAQPLYQLVLAAQEARLGTEDPGLLGTLYAVARVSQPKGDLPTAKDSLVRYAEIAETSGTADPRQHWQVLSMLARLEIVSEDNDAALQWQRRAADAIAEDPSATEDERAVQLESLAQMELTAGEGRRAEMALVQLATLRQEEDEADAMARTMAEGSAAAFAAGELETAERLAMRALNAHPDTAAEKTARTVLADISWARVNRGTDDFAILLAAASDDEEILRARDRLRSLNVFEKSENRKTLRRLAQAEALRGQPGEAALYQRELIVIIDETDGPASAAALAARSDLVTLLVAAGEIDEALAENAAVLAAMEAQYGADDPRLLPVLEQRLEVLTAAGQKKQAKKVRKRIKKLAR